MNHEFITKIMRRFQRALVSLVPIADEAEISWRDGESYDEWDRMAQALFQSFVIDTICNNISRSDPFAEYDMRYASYSSLSHILVEVNGAPDPYIFIAFSTQDEPFDSIRVVSAELDDTTAGISTVIRAEEVVFSVACKGSQGSGDS